MAWATLADCTSIAGSAPGLIPGQTATPQGTLNVAQAMIEDAVNRTEAAEGSFRARDLEWLKKAVVWQAAWLPSQPGILGRVMAQSVTQDGTSAQFRSAADQTLAPLAQRAIKNLSWMGSRSLRTTTRFQRLGEDDLAAATNAAFLASGADPEHGWDRM